MLLSGNKVFVASMGTDLSSEIALSQKESKSLGVCCVATIFSGEKPMVQSFFVCFPFWVTTTVQRKNPGFFKVKASLLKCPEKSRICSLTKGFTISGPIS
ncbi:hypothetical protein D3C72_2123600 [compost metagenome]